MLRAADNTMRAIPHRLFADEPNRQKRLRKGQAALFCRNEFKYVREAWEAAQFARFVGQGVSTWVKLGPGDLNPDFYLRQSGVDRPFEATWLDLWVEKDTGSGSSRRIGKEYVDHVGGRKAVHDDLDMHDWTLRNMLPIFVQKKVDRSQKYNEKRSLLVHLNLWMGGKIPVSSDVLQALTASGKEAFSEIWLLWGFHAVRVWPDYRDIIGLPGLTDQA
jgi:hypothetical protein